MRIKDQIRLRRDAAGLSLKGLGDRVGVTEQAVRHWESGRSNPGKATARLLEEALNFSLDWSEGANRKIDATALSMVQPGDIELLVKIARLPKGAKKALAELVDVLDIAARTPGSSLQADLPQTRKSRAMA
ncbi:helix-turn-helix transcriptional regulator [Rhizobacter sp. Root404]|uniref:helix-turn-helix transcriptional regulator n=1 Tax=Rhizobacter sp. Root404 TaxID=1736528 RepID=UPI000A6674E9|nr:helix-turn-helix transcriptional regulator [Rhizobacter sp. Root404]